MASDQDKDDIAAALHGLSSGEHDERAEEHGHDEPAAEPAPAPPPASQKAARPPIGQRPPARPAAPGAPTRPAQAVPKARPSTPSTGGSTSSTRPPASKRPTAPPARPAGPPAVQAAIVPPGPPAHSGRARPAAPGEQAAASQEDEAPEDASEESTGEPLDYRSKPPVPARPPSMFRTIGFRRTIIPILLTTGVMLMATGAAKWIVDDQAPLGRFPAYMGMLLLLVGALLVAAGVGNMFMVRNQLAREKAAAPAPR